MSLRLMFAGFVALTAGCTPWYYRESCVTRTAEEARQQVSRQLREAHAIEILECFVIPKTASVHGCVLRIDPKDFPTLFPGFEFSAEEPYPDPKKSFTSRIAARHRFDIAGMMTASWEDPYSRYTESLRLLYNAPRDRVIALIHEYECSTPAEIIN
jgi:hypothetical protein